MFQTFFTAAYRAAERARIEAAVAQIQIVMIAAAICQKADEAWNAVIKTTLGVVEGPLGYIWERFETYYEAVTKEEFESPVGVAVTPMG
jgi:hypothetical protein